MDRGELLVRRGAIIGLRGRQHEPCHMDLEKMKNRKNSVRYVFELFVVFLGVTKQEEFIERFLWQNIIPLALEHTQLKNMKFLKPEIIFENYFIILFKDIKH